MVTIYIHDPDNTQDPIWAPWVLLGTPIWAYRDPISPCRGVQQDSWGSYWVLGIVRVMNIYCDHFLTPLNASVRPFLTIFTILSQFTAETWGCDETPSRINFQKNLGHFHDHWTYLNGKKLSYHWISNFWHTPLWPWDTLLQQTEIAHHLIQEVKLKGKTHNSGRFPYFLTL